MYSDDVARDDRFTHTMFRSFPHQSGLLLPLIVDDEVIGGFYLVWWTTRRRFSARDLRSFDHVCEQVGFFLRNARLYEQAERNRHRLEVLNDVSRRLAAVHDPEEVLTIIVNEAARLVGAEAAGLRLLEGDDLVVGARTESAATVMARPRLRVGESLSGEVVATGGPVVVEDLAADTRYDPGHKRGALDGGFLGFIGVPLRAHGRVVGSLNVFTRGVRHFLPDEIALLSALADQASLAIEKSRLLRETEEGRALLERLSHAAIAMQSSWDRDARLGAFVHAARDVVGFDRVNVFLLTADGSDLELVTAGGDGRSRAPAAGDRRIRSLPRDLEVPTTGRRAVGRGSRAGAPARSDAPRQRLSALASIRRRAARRRRSRDRRRQRRQQDEPSGDQPAKRRAVQLAVPEPGHGARGEPALHRGERASRKPPGSTR